MPDLPKFGIQETGWQGYDDAAEGICHSCGKKTIVRYVDDPYIMEVFGEHEPSNLCEECYDDRNSDT